VLVRCSCKRCTWVFGNHALPTVDERDARQPYTLELDSAFSPFLAEAALQSRYNWRPAYTAAAVIEHIREGFRPKEPGN
jgi:hypothetical protein